MFSDYIIYLFLSNLHKAEVKGNTFFTTSPVFESNKKRSTLTSAPLTQLVRWVFIDEVLPFYKPPDLNPVAYVMAPYFEFFGHLSNISTPVH